MPAAGWGIVAIIGFAVLAHRRTDRDDPARDRVRPARASPTSSASSILGGIVAILGASLAFAVVAGYVADALVGVALASLVMRGENSSRWRELAVLAVGAAVVVLLSSLPVVGPWVKLVVVLLGLGAILIAWRGRRETDAVGAPGGWVQPPATPQAPQTPAT